jgi:hypothetical protein
MEAVLRHFATLVQVISPLKTAEQLLNMDETGNSSRSDKGRVRRVVCSKQATVEAHFQDEPDVTQVSLAATASLSGRSVKPFFITLSNLVYRNPDLAMMRHEFASVQRAKG